MGSANLTRVEMDLSGAADPTRVGFPTTTTVEFSSSASQTWLDFLGEVSSVTINGADVPVEYDGTRIALTGLVDRNVVTVRATGRYSRSGEGCTGSPTRSTDTHTSIPCTNRPMRGACSHASSSRT